MCSEMLLTGLITAVPPPPWGIPGSVIHKLKNLLRSSTDEPEWAGWARCAETRSNSPLGGTVRLEAFMARDGETKSFRRVFIRGSWERVQLLSYVKRVLCAPALCCSMVNAASQGRCHPLSCTDSRSERGAQLRRAGSGL